MNQTTIYSGHSVVLSGWINIEVLKEKKKANDMKGLSLFVPHEVLRNNEEILITNALSQHL